MMNNRLQLALTDESRTIVENVMRDANENFDVGSITYSDVINEMILSSKIDIKALQVKHTDIRRSLRKMASDPSLDLESAIKSLTDLKAKTSGRRPTKANMNNEEAS